MSFNIDKSLNEKIFTGVNARSIMSMPLSISIDPSGIPASASVSQSNLLKRIYNNMLNYQDAFPVMEALLQANEQNYNLTIPDILLILNDFQANINSYMSEYSDLSANQATSMLARIIVLDEKNNVCYDSSNSSITYKVWKVANDGKGLITNSNNFTWSNSIRTATMNPTPGYGFEIVASWARQKIGYFCAFPVGGPGNNYGSVIFSIY